MFEEEAVLTLCAGHSCCQHSAEERKREVDAWRKRSYVLILNNGEFNKMRHEEKKSNGFVNIKKRSCG